MRSRRALRAENAALREQVRLLLESQARLYTQTGELRREITALRRRPARSRGPVHAGAPIQGEEQPAYFEADPADTVPMPRVRSQVPAPAWPPEAWRPQ